MSDTRVLHPRNLPAQLPINTTIIVWLLMDRLGTSGVWRGATYALLALLWLVALTRLLTQQFVKIWDDPTRR